MKSVCTLLLGLAFAASAVAQDQDKEALKKELLKEVEKRLKSEDERLLKDIEKLIEQELKGAPKAAPVAMGKPPPTAPPGTWSQSCGGAVLVPAKKGPRIVIASSTMIASSGMTAASVSAAPSGVICPRPGAIWPACCGAGGSRQLSSSASRASASGKSSSGRASQWDFASGGDTIPGLPG